ncbi:MAG: radical SAM protein, partial [Kiritimatiellae bacterium]|nr:radical SAM protein [Kiritimatiellia bacterium]
MIPRCELCPRRCGVDRSAGALGFCQAGTAPRVFRWGPHFGEEPPICGPSGSGAVFFSRCTMKCLYCQNSPWSWKGEGEDVPVERLTSILRELAVDDGCANWNLVSPTPYLPFIRSAAKPILDDGIRLPFVWNSSGYESAETLAAYRDLCDVALFDLRYAEESTARAASSAPGYVAASRAAVKWAWDNLGPLDSDEPGRA